ncbi:MAG: hypothetical protein IJY42_05325 [Clostridia bacterium]|nr:hypothetical protein [Clostridia bacterium]
MVEKLKQKEKPLKKLCTFATQGVGRKTYFCAVLWEVESLSSREDPQKKAKRTTDGNPFSVLLLTIGNVRPKGSLGYLPFWRLFLLRGLFFVPNLPCGNKKSPQK